jgi:hypothetical protein
MTAPRKPDCMPGSVSEDVHDVFDFSVSQDLLCRGDARRPRRLWWHEAARGTAAADRGGSRGCRLRYASFGHPGLGDRPRWPGNMGEECRLGRVPDHGTERVKYAHHHNHNNRHRLERAPAQLDREPEETRQSLEANSKALQGAGHRRQSRAWRWCPGRRRGGSARASAPVPGLRRFMAAVRR